MPPKEPGKKLIMEQRNDVRNTYVYANWAGIKEPALMGELKAEFARGKEIFSFSYDKEWLKSRFSQILDHDLLFYSGSQYAGDKKSNFGVFLDSSPDRWGRILMKRLEAATARNEGRTERTLRESDYLLGVFDGHRMGAVRFKKDPDGPIIIDRIRRAVSDWHIIANKYQLPKSEQEIMAKVFERFLIIKFVFLFHL